MSSARRIVRRILPDRALGFARRLRGGGSTPPPPAPFTAFNLAAVIARGGEFAGSLRLRPGAEERERTLAGEVETARFVDHIDHQPPPADLVFVGVCNDKYAPGLEALLLSLHRVYPGLRNRFIVFHDAGLSELSMHRLREVHPAVEFARRDPAHYAVAMGDAYNHKRVGLLGYLTLEALTMADPSWVVILDTDLLILGDISPLWRGGRPKAVPDIGVRPYALRAQSTGQLVINSGVISLPRSERGPEATARMDRVLASLATHTDPLLDQFADQRFWNVYLAERDLELLPQNFNTNKALYAGPYERDEAGSTSILHITGPKPWFDFIDRSLLADDDLSRLRTARKRQKGPYVLWDQLYRSEMLRSRLGAFRAQESAALEDERGRAAGRPVVLIGNGPSLARTDMSAFDGYEKVVFNWFVRHEDFDTIRPEHLVLPSHMLFGGWHTPTPKLPADFLAALTAHEHRPTLWISHYFKPYIETVPELAGYTIRYYFFEKPFKRRLEMTGWAPLDLTAPLVDSNTGVLTAGVAMALHFGASHIVLVGCDSNYSSASGSYFYAAAEHSSLTTREDQLLRTWEAGGTGEYGYGVVGALLAERGVPFLDATVGGSLTVVPKATLDEARSIGAAG
ncbi:hypothetical protein [Demequina lignilytica]|uniref:Lipopolysaccharide biosynthesis protein, LPS:glycosyltransferase n=1 Tax=Demequina lignilytica TaxID=3051663 RepID=A0AB35MKF3_9MICO|nr:hypothetical protein [Demequina sp. SYSU T0a273]MDN4484319.1 hypothetical protein [Demequina sp. SYSU T0a273]